MTWFESESLDRERWRTIAEEAVERGATALERGLFPATLMLTGPRGAGRELAAVELAALLVSTAGRPQPWCDDPVAHRVRAGTHPDVTALRPEATGKRTIRVAAVRDVVESAPGKPHEGACRVWILDGVDRTTIEVEAANALLKVLEEPPAHAHFIVLAETPSSVLPTIRSRSATLGLPGAVGVAARLGLGDPPELTGRGMAPQRLDETLPAILSALDKIADGDALAAVRLARLLADEDEAFALLSAAALRRSGDGEHASVRLADACLEADRAVRSLGVLRAHQLLAVLLEWMRATVPDARTNRR